MKNKLFHGMLAIAVCGFLTSPVWARGQGGSHGNSAMHAHSANGHSAHAHHSMRSNKGGAVRGLNRAQQAQSMNSKADTERGFTSAPGMTHATSNASTQAGGNGAQSGSQGQK
jgi:hypothetical protein